MLGLSVLIGSGILSIMLEMLVLAYFQQMLIGSLYATAGVLFAFIVHLGLGSALAAWLRRRGLGAARLLPVLLAICGVLLLIYPAVFQGIISHGLLQRHDTVQAQVIEVGLAALALLAPLLIPVGTIFPLAWEMVEQSAVHQGQALGHMVAINKAGAALGALLGPFVLVPWLGLPGALLAASSGYLALGVAATNGKRVLFACAALAGAGLAWHLLAYAAPIALHDGEALRALYQGPSGVTAVLDDAEGSRHIVLNQTYTLNGTGRAMRSQQAESWIPLLLCAEPRRVAFVGMASGISATAALDFPLERLDAIELVPEVARAAREQFADWNHPLFADPRAHVVLDDGRHLLRSVGAPYDVVIIDLLHPALEGTSTLYAREMLTSIRARLAPGGRCCVWLPVYQMDEELAGIVLRTFTDVFPDAIAVRGNFDPLQPVVGLIGAAAPIDLSTDFLTHRLQSTMGRALESRSPFFRSPANARLMLLGDLQTLRSTLSAFPATTDDWPVFAFHGPKPLADGTRLRGMTYLHWFGSRFSQPDYPSCALGQTPPQALLAGINAGNNAFAAAIFALPAPREDPVERARRMLHYLTTAKDRLPAADIRAEDLGQ